MPRSWIWLQLLLGWLPVGALFALMLFIAHGGSPLTATVMALQLVVTAAALGLVVHRLTLRIPWPHPLRPSFLGVQFLAALGYALAWSVANVAIASLIASFTHSLHAHRLVLVFALGPSWGVSYLLAGFWLYIMVAGIAYANRAAARAAQIEALAARSQLEALRAQLHPHLLFNALHTVVQLIPQDPKRAAQAAEQLAAILRVGLAEQRDVVTLAEEWDFVQRYLAIESLRFGARLSVRGDIAPAALAALTPAFALQTLVENAIRHAAAPRIEPTTVTISARRDDDRVTLAVRDDGAGAEAPAIDASVGTGLRRLRERLAWLCGGAARLEIATSPGAGFEARLILPQSALRAAAAAHDADD